MRLTSNLISLVIILSMNNILCSYDFTKYIMNDRLILPLKIGEIHEEDKPIYHCNSYGIAYCAELHRI